MLKFGNIPFADVRKFKKELLLLRYKLKTICLWNDNRLRH